MLPNEGWMSSNLELELLGLFPREALVGTEVTVLGGLEIDGSVQVKLAHNDTRSHVEVVSDDGDEFIRSLVRGAVGVNVD